MPAKMPDVTKAQVVAFIKFTLAVAAAFSFNVPAHVQEVLIGSAGAIAAAIVIADALIRGNRAKALATIQTVDIKNAVKEALDAVKHGKPHDPIAGTTPLPPPADPGTPPPAFQDGAFEEDAHSALPTGRPAGLTGE